MAAASVGVYYRPVRLGWCIRTDNWDDLRRAIRLSHTLWGGRFNPIIPVQSPVATALVKLYGVDALFPVAEDSALKDFIATFPWLPWPNFDATLFIRSELGMLAAFLDIYHVVRNLFEEHIKDKPDPTFSATQFEWDQADPLSDIFLAYWGGYPSGDEVGKDYSEFVEKNLRGIRTRIDVGDQISTDVLNTVTPSALTAHMLEWESVPRWTDPGLYVGDAGDFWDIVNFWNLRAADAELVFWDPRHRDRLGDLAEGFLQKLAARVQEPMIERHVALWTKPGTEIDPDAFKQYNVSHFRASEAAWAGRKPKPARFRIGQPKSTLAVIDDKDGVEQMSVQLPPKPFSEEPEFFRQKLVVGVSTNLLLAGRDESTFQIPFLPQLNGFYGKRMLLNSREFRVEEGGPGVITSVTKSYLTLRAVSKREMVSELFKAFAMEAKASDPGRIASRIIHQMGGIQGCRVFKIAGVRALLRSVGTKDYFERTHAIQTIGECDPETGTPNFARYENLYIEYREPGPLKPTHAFLFLLRKGIFQVGLSFRCPNCELEPWISLDDLATESKCQYCGSHFLTTPQLRDRNWKYRWSGLFAREDDQQGSLPVVLTLQQLDTVLNFQEVTFVTNTKIEPAGARIEPCESDFVLLHQDMHGGRMSLAIGECKTGGEISEDDVRKLTAVADVFERNGVDAFIVFAKLAPFTPEEVARCLTAQAHKRRRVIMLTDRELEPYFVYERTQEEFEIQGSVISLDGLAEATDLIFFHPRPRTKPS